MWLPINAEAATAHASKEEMMEEKPEITESTATQFILVKDKTGKEFVCKLTDLKDPSHLTEEEKKRCYENVEDALKKLEGL